MEEKLNQVRQELEDMKNTFPGELKKLQQDIKTAKDNTDYYTKATEQLAEELKRLKEQAAAAGKNK